MLLLAIVLDNNFYNDGIYSCHHCKNYYRELLRASEVTLSRWSWLHLQPLTPTNTHWVRGGL
jgi:hypothetical protein